MTLHLSHIVLTLARTFIDCSLVPVGDATSAEVVGGEFHLHAIARKDADVVHPHLARDVGQNFVTVLELHLEHGIGQRFLDRALQYDGVFLGLCQGVSPQGGMPGGTPYE